MPTKSYVRTTRLLLVLIIFFFLSSFFPYFTFSQTSSNCIETSIGTIPKDASGGCSQQCDIQAPNDLQTIKTGLLADGIIITGDELDIPNATEVYNTWCLLKKSSKYLQLLGAKSDPIEVRFKHTYESQGSHAFPCAGFSSAVIKPRFIELYGAQGSACATYRLDFLIAHELGHQIRFKNPDIYNKWYSTAYNPSFPTWNCQKDYGPGPWPEECFPDMIAEYVFYKKWEMFTEPPQPFLEMKTTYLTMYTFTRDNIFGGTEY